MQYHRVDADAMKTRLMQDHTDAIRTSLMRYHRVDTVAMRTRLMQYHRVDTQCTNKKN